MSSVGHDNEEESYPEKVFYVDTDIDNDTEDCNNNDCIICREYAKGEHWSPCFLCKYRAHANCSGWVVDQARHRPRQCDFCS